jgi:hypothetical protein
MEQENASCVFGGDRPAQEPTDQDACDPPSDEITIEYRQPKPNAESVS